MGRTECRPAPPPGLEVPLLQQVPQLRVLLILLVYLILEVHPGRTPAPCLATALPVPPVLPPIPAAPETRPAAGFRNMSGAGHHKKNNFIKLKAKNPMQKKERTGHHSPMGLGALF